MAVHIRLKQFDGPLDLLLHLIGKAKIDLKVFSSARSRSNTRSRPFRSRISTWTRPASSWPWAALLLEIKSRSLLPKPPKEDEEDPEQLLLQRLIAYKQFKETAQRMAEFEKNAREVFGKLPEEYPLPPPEIEIDGLTLEALWEALKRVQERAPKETEEVVFQLRNIHRENFTVEGCMETIESRLSVWTMTL